MHSYTIHSYTTGAAPYNATYVPSAQCETDEKLELARRAAREGIVLLKNEHNALPLSLDTGLKLALVGPQADDWRVLVGAVNYAPYAHTHSYTICTTHTGK
jgi:beta-glucosidase-like glycosyl hydrolase